VRGNRVCIRRLVEAGSDVSAKDGENRTPRDMAAELKSLGAYKRALEEGGMNENGVKIKRPMSDVCRYSFFSWVIGADARLGSATLKSRSTSFLPSSYSLFSKP
jgi:hypothetical protein